MSLDGGRRKVQKHSANTYEAQKHGFRYTDLSVGHLHSFTVRDRSSIRASIYDRLGELSKTKTAGAIGSAVNSVGLNSALVA